MRGAKLDSRGPGFVASALKTCTHMVADILEQATA